MRSKNEIEQRLEAADARCTRKGARMTKLRREVLKLILEAGGPIGAYRLLDKLKVTRLRAAPPTVYRALGFLLQYALVHRVERLNAFIACDDPGGHDHAAQLLICRACGRVDEVEDKGVAEALRRTADVQGFKLSHNTIEVEGICANCGIEQTSRLSTPPSSPAA